MLIRRQVLCDCIFGRKLVQLHKRKSRDPFNYGMDDRIFVNYGMDDRTLLMGHAVAHSHSHTCKIMASTSAASSTENSVAEVRRLTIHLQ